MFPPRTNGIMKLTDEQIQEIRQKLQDIQAEFVPTEDEPTLTTHGLVSRYNQQNVGSEINGDTAEFILS